MRVLIGAAAVALVASLAACATTAAFSPTVVATDVKLIAAGLGAALPQVQGIGPAPLASMEKALSDIEAVAGGIDTATTLNAAQVSVQSVETDVAVIMAALEGVPLPPGVTVALQAATVLVPVLEADVAIVTAPTAAASASFMTPDAARAALRSAAAR